MKPLLLALALLLALGPFQKNHPAVDQGLQHYQAGRYEDALKAFDSAKKELPDNAAVEFNRGNALYKLRRLEEAKEAYHRVAELDRGQLRQKDYYNLGNVWAELGQTKDAVAAYRKALVLDPRDEAARHNLEVVLRQLPPPKSPPRPQPDGGSDGGIDGGSDGGSADGGRGDGGTDGGQGGQGRADGGRPDPRGDGGTRDGGQGQPSRPEDEQRDGGGDPAESEPEPPPPEEGRDGGVEAEMNDLSKKDVERLLDSMKQSEKNLQLWRFQQRKKKPRKDDAKDW